MYTASSYVPSKFGRIYEIDTYFKILLIPSHSSKEVLGITFNNIVHKLIFAFMHADYPLLCQKSSKEMSSQEQFPI